MNTIGRILGEATRPPTKMELTDSSHAYYYAKDVIGGQFPEGEAALAKDPGYACIYAMHVIEGPFPEGEAVIAKNPGWAYQYAVHVIKGRWPEGEEAIARNRTWSKEYMKEYMKLFPEVKMEWFANRWIDWTQL